MKGDDIMIWEPIKGYEGLYEVSEHGVVRSCARYIKTNIRHVETRLIEGRFLKQNTKHNGYRTVDLCKEGKAKTVLVHRIVATAFCPNPNKYRFVNHIDSNRANNDSCNLEWVSSSENRMHGIKYGNVTFKARPICCKETGMIFKGPQAAAEWINSEYPERIKGTIRVAAHNILEAAKRNKHTAYGFTWEHHEGSTTIP